MPGNHRAVEPPDPISNSVVKRVIADGSVGFPHVRVGHCQAPNIKERVTQLGGPFFMFGARSLCPLQRGHVKAHAPKVQGLGAAGVAQQLRTPFAT